MKTHLLTRQFSLTLLTAAASLVSVHLVQAQPSPVLPVQGAGNEEPWDMLLAGQRRGTAQVTFFRDGTLLGYQQTTLAPVKSSSVNPRTGMVDNESPELLNRTNLVGGADLSGVWYFDYNQKIIGSFIEVFTVESGGTSMLATNAYSFRAQVNPGRAIIMNAQGPAGRVTYRGHPTIPLANISGFYYAYNIHSGLTILEFLTFSPTPVLNLYDVVGTGPNYSYTGSALLVRQGQLSIVTGADGSNKVVRSVSGPFRAKAAPPRGNLSGQQDNVVGNVRFRLNP